MSELPEDPTGSAAVDPSPVVAGAPVRKKRRWLRRLGMAAGVFGLLMTALLCSVPYIVSAESVRTGIAEELSRQLNTRVSVRGHDFSWFDGLRIEGIAIDNPKGFPQTHKAFKIDRLIGDVSVMSLLWGKFQLSGVVEGMEVRLYEKVDGRTNFGVMLANFTPATAPGGSDGGSNGEAPEVGELSGEFDLTNIDVDLRVVDSLIELVHEERGVVESLRHVETGIRKPVGSSALRLHFNADMHTGEASPGRIDFVADLDSDTSQPSSLSFKTAGFDLSRYRSLVNSLVEPSNYPEAFAGVLGGEMKGEYRHGKGLTLSGDMELVEPHFKGRLFGGLDLQSPKWIFKPHLVVGFDERLAVQTVSTEGFDVQMGFVQVLGMSGPAAKKFAQDRTALGIRFDVDLRKLAEMGLTLLDGVKQGTGRVTGTTTIVAEMDPDTDFSKLVERWSELVRSEVQVSLDGFKTEGVQVTGLIADTVVENGELRFKTRSGARLNGGPLDLSAVSKVADLATATADVTMKWQGGTIGGDAVRWLRYAVPLLDGLPIENAEGLDFHAKINVEMLLDGPVLPKTDESVLQWLDHWVGKGDLALLDGGFTPAPVWKTVLEFAGLKSPVAFKTIDSKFAFQDGGVTTELMRFNRGAKSWALSGSVGMDGVIDYGIDLCTLLRGHKDGERVLKYLDEKPIEAKVAGTLDAPSLVSPSYGDLLKKVAVGAASGALDKLLEKKGVKLPKGLKDLFKRK